MQFGPQKLQIKKINIFPKKHHLHESNMNFQIQCKISVHNNNLLHLYSSCSMCHPGTSCFALPLGCILSKKLSSLARIPSQNKQEVSNCFESNPELGYTDSEKRKNKLHQKKCKTLKKKKKKKKFNPVTNHSAHYHRCASSQAQTLFHVNSLRAAAFRLHISAAVAAKVHVFLHHVAVREPEGIRVANGGRTVWN